MEQALECAQLEHNNNKKGCSMNCGVFVSAETLRVLFFNRTTISAIQSLEPKVEALSQCLSEAGITKATLLLPEQSVSTSVYTHPGFWCAKSCFDALLETQPEQTFDFCYRHDPYLKKTHVCAAYADVMPWDACKGLSRIASLRLILMRVLPKKLLKQLSLAIYSFAGQHHFCLSEGGVIWAYVAIDTPSLGVDELHWGMQHIQQQYTGAAGSVRVIFDESLYSLLRSTHKALHYVPIKFKSNAASRDDKLMAFALSRRLYELA